jgi:hypothetical protein
VPLPTDGMVRWLQMFVVCENPTFWGLAREGRRPVAVGGYIFDLRLTISTSRYAHALSLAERGLQRLQVWHIARQRHLVRRMKSANALFASHPTASHCQGEAALCKARSPLAPAHFIAYRTLG